MANPANCRYTKEHEWAQVEGTNATIGITDFAQSELGEIVFADLPEVGKKYSQGQTICVLESTKAASDVYAPVSGVVKEVNVNLRDDPSLINKNPYEEGWLVKLENIETGGIASLMTADEYTKYLG